MMTQAAQVVINFLCGGQVQLFFVAKKTRLVVVRVRLLVIFYKRFKVREVEEEEVFCLRNLEKILQDLNMALGDLEWVSVDLFDDLNRLPSSKEW